MRLAFGLALLAVGALAAAVQAQQVTKESVPGITNFSRLQTTIACAGAVEVSAVPDIKKLGYNSIINLRQASEQGANIEASQAAAKTAGINYVHIPFNTQAPDPEIVPQFLAAVTAPANQPAFVHCAGAGRAAAMWMIKRMQVDGWDQQKAGEEAAALGLANERLKQFAIDWVATHKK
jgi:uncharacterized protein (TIGR01244 family)